MAVEYMSKKLLKGAVNSLGSTRTGLFPFPLWMYLEASHFCFLLGFFPLGADFFARCFVIFLGTSLFLSFLVKHPGLEPSHKIRKPSLKDRIIAQNPHVPECSDEIWGHPDIGTVLFVKSRTLQNWFPLDLPNH